MSAVVYRAYDADGRLLYVGSSVDVGGRLRHHVDHAPWWPSLSCVTTESFDTPDMAREAELGAIAAEHPRWNVVGRSPDHPDGVITQGRGRFGAPWLRDEIRQWQAGNRARARGLAPDG